MFATQVLMVLACSGPGLNDGKVSYERDSVRDAAVVSEEIIVALVPPVYVVTEWACLSVVSDVELSGDIYLEVGEFVYTDEELLRGSVVNDGQTDVLVVDGDGNEVVIPPGATLATQCSGKCMTEGCPDGTHACCYWTRNGCARCRCVKDGKLPEPGIACDSGGGTGCSMSDEAAPRLPVHDDAK